MKTRLRILFFLCSGLIIAGLLAAPFIFIAQQTKGVWHGVPPLYTDNYYYYARIKEVYDVHGIGNPYFIEHTAELAPAFFITDWISAVPLFFGSSMMAMIGMDFVFWSLALVFLVYAFFRYLKIPSHISWVGAALTFVMTYALMVRPVSMQVIYPFFVWFLISFFMWLREPRRNLFCINLIIATSASFYIYTYLWQITFVTLGLAMLFYAYERQWKVVRTAACIILGAVALSIPMIIYTIHQIKNPVYWETMERIGLLYTHVPAARVVVIFLILSAFLGAWGLIRRGVPEIKAHEPDGVFKGFMLLGAAIAVTSVSNIFTGKELEIPQHVERFVIVWLALGVVWLGYALWNARHSVAAAFRAQTFALTHKKKASATIVIIVAAVCVIVGALLVYIHDGLLVSADSENSQGAIRDVQEYAAPLAWLAGAEKTPVVIFAHSDVVNHYIPILTQHYVLFDGPGLLHFMSNAELEERFLIQQYPHEPSALYLASQMRGYLGVGNGVHRYKLHNREVWLCGLIQKLIPDHTCGSITPDALAYWGRPYFDGRVQQYKTVIQPHFAQELHKFHVQYIIVDTKFDTDFEPEKFAEVERVYRDQRFLIYKLK